jgi:hypothetical protein
MTRNEWEDGWFIAGVLVVLYALAVWLAPSARMVIDRQERNKDND